MTERYYETYWSEGGFKPTRETTPAELAALYAQHIPKGAKCLDLGCGDGGTSSGFLIGSENQYVGVDISEAALELARQRGLEVLRIESAERLPFPDGSFGAVVCIEVLEHLFAPAEAAAEARRVLEPGGVFIATVPNAAYWRERADMLIGAWQPGGDLAGRAEPWRSPHIRFFSPASLKHMLAVAGYQRTTVRGFPTALGNRIPGLRTANPGRLSTLLSRRLPGLFSSRLWAVGIKAP